MANGYHQAYGFKLYVQLIKAELIDLSTIKRQSGFGAGKFMDGTTLMSASNTVVAVGEETNYKIFSGVPKTITKVAVASNVVTLTFGAAHGFVVGDTIYVRDLPVTYAALNGVYTVATITSVSPFTVTYALTTANVSETTVASGTAMTGVLKLDGTDAPARLLGLTNCSPDEGGNSESVINYDTEAKGYDNSAPTSKSMTWTVAGQTNYNDPAYWLMRYAAKDAVDQGLMLKYCRVGPNKVNQASYGFGTIPSFSEPSEAGSIIKYNGNIVCFGPYEIEK